MSSWNTSTRRPAVPDLDNLTREQLPEDARAVADALDDWVCRRHGILSSHHGAGLFLKLLAEEGYEVRRVGEQRDSLVLLGAILLGHGGTLTVTPRNLTLADPQRVIREDDPVSGAVRFRYDHTGAWGGGDDDA